MKILDASQTATKLIKVLDKGNNKYCQKKIRITNRKIHWNIFEQLR